LPSTIGLLKFLLLFISSASADYLLVGVSGTLQDGFPLRDRLDYRQSGQELVPAIFIGKGLVRGYKAYLDVKDAGCREYRPEPEHPTVPNAVVLATGCYEHANIYHIFAVDARQFVHILNGEPRFLSITPDTGLLELSASDPAVQRLAAHEIQRQGKSDMLQVAIPLVTGVWFQSTYIEMPPIEITDDGTQITSYDGGLALWAGVLRDDLVESTSSNLEEQCRVQLANGAEDCDTNDDNSKLKLAWEAVYGATRSAERAKYSTDRPENIQCQQQVRFGVSSAQARINYPLSRADLEEAKLAV